MNKAVEKDRDRKIWEMWLTIYPNMTKDNFISFNDYRDGLINKRKEQTDEEMLHNCKLLNLALGGEVIEC